jgi:membrane protein DedA with SNARE-associated domain
MDNHAYEKYKQENPDVYTPLSTYEYIDQFVHQLTVAETIVCVVAVVLAVFAIYKIVVKRKDKNQEDHLE